MQKIILSTLFLIISFICDYVYGKQTYNLSNQITKYFQSIFDYGNENGLVESILLIFYTLSKKYIIGIIFIILWLKSGVKEQILKLITMHSIASYLGHIFKMILIEPRPFYEETEVRLDFCQRGYGSPSENALRSIVFYVILSETILFKKYKAQNLELDGFSQINQEQKLQYPYKVISNDDLYTSLYPNSILTYNQHKLMLGIFIFITGISNVYFGINYINQVIMGWILGGYILYLYYSCQIEKIIEKFYVQAIFNRQQELRFKIIQVSKISIFFIILLIITIIIYLYRMNFQNEILQQQEQWSEFYKKQPKCQQKLNYYASSFEKQDMIGSCIIFLPFYFFICCYFTPGHYKSELYKHSIISLKGLIRALILLFLIFGQVLMNIFIRRNIFGVDIDFKMRYLILFQLILQFYFSLALITLVPLFYKFCRVDVEGDFYRKINQSEIEEVEL